MTRAVDTTLAILAGGKARRLHGVPKGLLRLEGQTFIERLLKLSSCVGEVLLVTDDDDAYGSLPVPRIPDLVPDRGAPGGVHAALAQARTEWVAAIGCDMPFVSAEALEFLLSQRSRESDIVAFEKNGGLEPLFALYRARIAAKWAKLIEKPVSFKDLYPHFLAKVLPADLLSECDSGLRMFTNINSPEELRKTGALLPGATRTAH
jgi:molybdopterin-guanine dinucleotide biosynthesis protein A